MKKLVMTFAIVAFLIGGLTINANAQNKVPEKAKTENLQKKPKTPNYDQMLKEYETNINMYIAAYEKALKGGTTEKNSFMTYQKKALDLQAQLEKAKADLNEGQIQKFIQLKEKFAEALKRK